MITNCVNCGAPIESNKKACPYCKIPYGLLTNIELEMIEVTTLEDCEHRFIRK
mgnify:CR=1 FL=1